MVCRHCGYPNSTEAKYCSGCGRKLGQQNGPNRVVLGIAAVCVLIAGIGIGLLIPKGDDAGGGADAKDGANTSIAIGTEKEKKVEIEQVLPMEDGSVAVLYTDGTVRVSGNADFSGEVSDWGHVTQLYYSRYSGVGDGPILGGLTESGAVLTTEGEIPGWSDVKELHFTYEGVIGVTGDGRVLTYGAWEDDSYLTSQTNVESLVWGANQGIWGCLKKDGSVYLLSEYTDINEVYWNNVKELRSSWHAFYAMMKDGTVDGGMEETYAGLKDAVKVVDYNDWVFGVSADGRLLTHNGGNIYTNSGDMMVDVPGVTYYGEEVDIHQFDQIKDIVAFRGLILLNKDGTVDFIGELPNWDLSDWDNIEKVCGIDPDWENAILYGIKQDGSVITARYDWGRMVQLVTDQYRGWKLQDIYTGEGGVVGLTRDGKLVGDGIYENVDFSVFD